jgi:hypothetical protein
MILIFLTRPSRNQAFDTNYTNYTNQNSSFDKFV